MAVYSQSRSLENSSIDELPQGSIFAPRTARGLKHASHQHDHHLQSPTDAEQFHAPHKIMSFTSFTIADSLDNIPIPLSTDIAF